MPKSKDIAKYVKENNIDAKSIILMLEKYKAIAMLPAILKSLKHLHRVEYPLPVIECISNKNIDVIKDIENIFFKNEESRKIIENKSIVGGFRVIKDYKLYDYSVSGYIDRLFS